MNKILTLFKEGAPELVVRIKRCKPSELDAILAIQDRIVMQIPDRNRYQPTPMEEVAESLEQDICLGAYHGEKLVGFTILLNLRDTPRNLANEIGYPPEYAMLCATNDGSWVDPDYQGYGIQYRLSIEKDAIAIEMGARELLACTSPLNIPSQRSMLKNGYEIIAEILLYGGNPRYILRKMVAAAQESEEESA